MEACTNHHPSPSPLQLRWLLQFILISSRPFLSQASSYSCPIECRHGSCILQSSSSSRHNHHNTCECEDGYAGPACDIPYVACPDGRKCHNGSTCKHMTLKHTDAPPQGEDGNATIEINNNETTKTSHNFEYRCDCAAAFAKSDFAGEQCEDSKIAICESGGSGSNGAFSDAFGNNNDDNIPTAFCKNGGKCKRIVSSGEDHPGCYCRMGFEGTRCQYWPGMAPPEDLELYISKRTTIAELEGSSSSSIEGMTDAMIVVVVIGVVSFLGIMIYKTKRARGIRMVEMEARAVDSSSSELVFDSDGERVYII